ncbi:thiamine pyrophosphate-binding protein [Natrononativus amylolyticus]|uniref:thiamine pyrophosphate-binding protein n=1 Tax=Natrononativus amylolyticus TaxID=2963434 RepID=UPI0020CE42A5|nr:thiamine pyrophosphate-binding protein [Natrononativus amylolyticus]
MPATGADLFADALETYGVTHVFGNPGTTEIPLLEALGESDLEYVMALHEDIAVGMAGGYASTRRYHAHGDPEVCPLGVANLHIAPGTAHGLGNLYAAHIGGAPLLVTAGNHATEQQHEEPLLHGDLQQLTREFTKWTAEVQDVKALPTMLRRAVRVALTPPTGPVFLSLPIDVMTAETDLEPEPLGRVPSGGAGDQVAIERAADALEAAEEPVMVVGDGIARSGPAAVEATVELAETTGARVHGEILLAEVPFPMGHPQYVSHLPESVDAVQALLETDTVVFVGCSTNVAMMPHEDPLVDPSTTTIHIGDDPWELGKNEPADVSVIGDPGEIVAGVRRQLEADAITPDLEAHEPVREWVNEEVLVSETDAGDGRSKVDLIETLAETIPGARVVDESVTTRYALLSRWPLEHGQYVGNKSGGLGYGLPAAVGAAVAEGEASSSRPVVGLVGDGSYLYYPHTLYTASRYDIDLTVVVSNNYTYRILKENTVALLGGSIEDYLFPGMTFDPPVDFALNARSHGATAQQVGPDDDLVAALESATDHAGPVVLDVTVQD